jgi:hypothetical protein
LGILEDSLLWVLSGGLARRTSEAGGSTEDFCTVMRFLEEQMLYEDLQCFFWTNGFSDIFNRDL